VQIKSQNFKGPSREKRLTWISFAWDQITTANIIKSFAKLTNEQSIKEQRQEGEKDQEFGGLSLPQDDPYLLEESINFGSDQILLDKIA